MFLHNLTDGQQLLFCMLAKHLIDADQVLHDHEAEIEKVILRELHLTGFPTEMRPVGDLLNELDTMESQVQRNSLYVELVGIALVDQELHPVEVDLLESIRHRLSITDGLARQLQDFAERFHLLAAEGRLLVFESQNGQEPT